MDITAVSAADFLIDESGLTAIEYGLIAALISLVVIAGVSVIGPALSEIWTTWTTAVSDVST